jgi:hypothetical protein
LACLSNLCNKKASGEVIFVSFTYSLSQIIIFTVVNINTFFQAVFNHFAIIFDVVVFPFVQVTQTIIIFFDGNPYIMFAIIALAL